MDSSYVFGHHPWCYSATAWRMSFMRVLGIDFTSRPHRRKPLTCIDATLEGNCLVVTKDGNSAWDSFSGFEAALAAKGPWIAGIDFPFGQSRKFITNIGWPETWPGYVKRLHTLSRTDFREELDNYRQPRATGDKEHRRATDIACCSVSPQKLYGVPVGLMFYEGARRLLDAGVTIPFLISGDPQRIVVEAYPGVLARRLIGRRSYKHDTRRCQTNDQMEARRDLICKLLSGGLKGTFGITLKVESTETFVNDPTGDRLDTLLCAIQAAWGWLQRDKRYGAPIELDPLEGWICDPSGHVYSPPPRSQPVAVD
jgi:hypothetical protein